MDVLVVGAGEMGRWFAEALPASVDVAFADLDRAAAADAATAVGSRARVAALESGETFETVCVAVPLPAAVSAIERHAPRAERAVVDVTGAMVAPVEAMARAAPDRERVSLHPLFAADAAPGTVARSTAADGPVTDRIGRWLTEAGNRLVDVGAAEHDDAMRTVQGRAHAAVLAFALSADAVPEGLATPVYEDLLALVERVTGNTPRVYADIQDTFDGAEEIAAAAESLAAADREEFERLYEDADPR
ncbi:MAG: prephenate dehydrogenase [Halobacteriaceae archaeon]